VGILVCWRGRAGEEGWLGGLLEGRGREGGRLLKRTRQ
jgi:hypothetical protein